MANSDDNNKNNNNTKSRHDRERPEDNPFIAFRRFADSQVSSLMNTVFTLPATIANYNNVHQAREACLFKKADKAQCDQLQELESEIAGLRHQGRELYRVGDLQQVLKKSEELMELDRHADGLRKKIVGQTDHDEDSKELVHRVANKKGQEWAWDWSWGFPKPFDDGHGTSHVTPVEPRDQALDYYRQVEAETKRLFGHEAWDEAVGALWGAMESNPMLRGLLDENELDQVRRLVSSTRPYSPQALEADSQMQHAGVNWREAYEDLVHAQDAENNTRRSEIRSRAMKSYRKRVPWVDEEKDDEPSYEYSHDHEDQHDDPPTPKTKQGGGLEDWCHSAEDQDDRDIRAFIEKQRQHGRHLGLYEQAEYALHPWCSFVPEQSASDKWDIAKFLSKEQRENNRWLGVHEPESTDDWCDPAQDQSASDKRDIQKLLSDQEKSGRELALRDAPTSAETELDAYEQLLEKPKTSDYAKAIQSRCDAKPSILSTLTTTERTVALDGSVTTKVVLKKRFADGREESSETVHTQRGQERDAWEIGKTTGIPKSGKDDDSQGKENRKGGWFWSS